MSNISFYQKHELSKKIGFVMLGEFPKVPPTAYVRLIDWKQWFEYNYNGEVEYINWKYLLTEKVARFKLIVIQRNAIPAESVDLIITALINSNIPYIFELDDNLLNVPIEIDIDLSYQNYRPYLEKLISHAESVHVTNTRLKNVCKKFNENIIIRPNKLLKSRWLAKTKEIKLNVNRLEINILYFGSKTHQIDLDFILTVISEMNKTQKVNLYLVGGGNFNSILHPYVYRLKPKGSRYDRFVDWLISIKSNFDLGVVPLLENDFSVYKSYLKCLEFSALSLPIVCSKNQPYTDLDITQLGKIEFSENNIEEWIIKIDTIMGSKSDNSAKMLTSAYFIDHDKKN